MLPKMLPLNKILCPTDFSETSYAALQQAAELASDSGAELLLIHVVPFPAPNPKGFRSEAEAERYAREEAEMQLRELASRRLAHLGNVSHLVVCGSPVGTVAVETARKEGVDLIVIGTHGLSGWRRLVLGSVATEVVRSATCPVLTVRSSQENSDGDKKILCPTDYSAPSLAALERAGELAARWNAPLYLLHVTDKPARGVASSHLEQSRSSEAAQSLLPLIEKHLPQEIRESTRFNRLVRTGKPATEIVRAAEEQDVSLIVMATHGETGWRRWVFGSVTEEVIRTAPCAVLSVHYADANWEGRAGEPAQEAAAEPSAPPQPWRVQEAQYPAGGNAEEKLQFLLNYAILAPSNRNSQPWIFRVQNDTVELRADRARALPHLDPNDRQLILSCGAALLHLRVAMRHFGHQDEVKILPDESDADLLARVKLGKPTVAPESEQLLFHAIVRRHTNRQPFLDEELPAELKRALQDEAKHEGARLAFLENAQAREALIDLIAKSDRQLGSDPAFVDETTSWLRPGYSLSPDGIPKQAWGEGGLMSPAGDPGEAQSDKDELLAWSAPALAILETEDDTPREWLAAGQALARVLLRASAENVQASFFNSPIEVAQTWPELHHVLKTAGLPQIILRLGYPRQETGPTPRRAVSDVTRPQK